MAWIENPVVIEWLLSLNVWAVADIALGAASHGSFRIEMNCRVKMAKTFVQKKETLLIGSKCFFDSMARPSFVCLFFLLCGTGFPLSPSAGTPPEDVLGLLKSDDTAIPPPLLALIERATPVPNENGIIEKLDKASDREGAILAFCATALRQKGAQYAYLVELIHQELITSHDVESGVVRSLHPIFLQSPNRERLFYRCLEHDAANAAPETLYRLYQIEFPLSGERLPKTPVWLVQAAEAGHVRAQYVLARAAWDNAYKPAAAPAALRPYINPDSYHRLLRSAAESGNRKAQLDLAYFYLGRTPAANSWKNNRYVNIDEGIRWLKRLTEQSENPHARYKAAEIMGMVYLKGSEVPDDYRGLLSSFQHREKDRLPNQGTIVAKDHREALRWFLLIPENELHHYCPVSMGLAEIYRAGEGVAIDKEKYDHYQRIVSSHCIKK